MNERELAKRLRLLRKGEGMTTAKLAADPELLVALGVSSPAEGYRYIASRLAAMGNDVRTRATQNALAIGHGDPMNLDVRRKAFCQIVDRSPDMVEVYENKGFQELALILSGSVTPDGQVPDYRKIQVIAHVHRDDYVTYEASMGWFGKFICSVESNDYMVRNMIQVSSSGRGIEVEGSVELRVIFHYSPLNFDSAKAVASSIMKPNEQEEWPLAIIGNELHFEWQMPEFARHHWFAIHWDVHEPKWPPPWL